MGRGPEQEAIRRHFIEARYQLMPYLYTLAEEASRTGLPLCGLCSLNSPMPQPMVIQSIPTSRLRANSCWDQFCRLHLRRILTSRIPMWSSFLPRVGTIFGLAK